jgi:hypothetical protein
MRAMTHSGARHRTLECEASAVFLTAIQRSFPVKETELLFKNGLTTMSQTVTLELSAELAARARVLAAATNRRIEDVVAEWVGRGAAEPAVECASDEELIALCDALLPSQVQRELSDLLDRDRESLLDASERRRLDELMASYRQGLVLKAKAWREAVERGLRPRLSDDPA